jgi:endonuclease/exonuclease/phosphatase family metal-dependent hydrolase
VRLATWNVHNGAGPDGRVDGDRFGAAVAALGADLLALQEVDRDQPRSGELDLTRIAVEAMGAEAHRFAAAMVGPPDGWVAATGQAEPPPGTPSYGVALLSRFPVTGWHVVRLPGLSARVPYRFATQPRPRLVRDEARVGLVADIATPEGPLRLVAAHLSFLPLSNGRQLRRLLPSCAREDVAVLAGDLNLGPRRAARITGMRPLAAGRTFPAGAPARQLDHLLARGPVRSGSGGPQPLPVSDHQALVADITLGQAP